MEYDGEMEFRKSSFSASSQCVEVAFVDNDVCQVMVRDSKHRGGSVLQFTDGEWDAFLKGVRAGEFG